MKWIHLRGLEYEKRSEDEKRDVAGKWDIFTELDNGDCLVVASTDTEEEAKELIDFFNFLSYYIAIKGLDDDYKLKLMFGIEKK
jgi:hypothetical protein